TRRSANGVFLSDPAATTPPVLEHLNFCLTATIRPVASSTTAQAAHLHGQQGISIFIPSAQGSADELSKQYFWKHPAAYQRHPRAAVEVHASNLVLRYTSVFLCQHPATSEHLRHMFLDE
ncbi:MAG: hypothetical protein Q9173_002747, partial [Seirophora scorigena]